MVQSLFCFWLVWNCRLLKHIHKGGHTTEEVYILLHPSPFQYISVHTLWKLQPKLSCVTLFLAVCNIFEFGVVFTGTPMISIVCEMICYITCALHWQWRWIALCQCVVESRLWRRRNCNKEKGGGDTWRYGLEAYPRYIDTDRLDCYDLRLS